MTFRERLIAGQCPAETLYTIVELFEKLGLQDNLDAYDALGFSTQELDLWRKHGLEKFIQYLQQLYNDDPNEQRLYVVCVDAAWIRNAEVVETKEIKGLDIDPAYIYSKQAVWHAIEHNAFIDIVTAKSEREARAKAGTASGHDPRCLFAIPIRLFL